MTSFQTYIRDYIETLDSSESEMMDTLVYSIPNQNAYISLRDKVLEKEVAKIWLKNNVESLTSQEVLEEKISQIAYLLKEPLLLDAAESSELAFYLTTVLNSPPAVQTLQMMNATLLASGKRYINPERLSQKKQSTGKLKDYILEVRARAATEAAQLVKDFNANVMFSNLQEQCGWSIDKRYEKQSTHYTDSLKTQLIFGEQLIRNLSELKQTKIPRK